ncbi:MAG: hypothetical protein KAT15_30410, partial [Bacteroidales bacterium]|nr:hypothetical protein [Bacteroidales bacterium]
MQSIRNIPIAFFLLFGELFFHTSISARSTDLYGQFFTTQSGLSQSAVNAILQDSLGFLWIGTGEGLNKYDGYSFQQFRYQPDTISLSSNAIRCLAEGSEGVIWVGTDFGLNKLDRLRGYLWTNYLPEQEEKNQGSSQLVHALHIDEQDNVWIRTERNLAMLDPATEQFTYYELFYDESNPSHPEEFYSMVWDPLGYIWIGTKDGLQVLEPGTGEHFRYSLSGNYGLLGNNVREVFLDHEGRIWCGTDRGLFLFLREQDRFQEAGAIFPELGGLNVLSIAENKKGELLIGTHESLVKIHPDLDRAEIFNGFYRPDILTRFAKIKTMHEDASEILWLGTSMGLIKIDQKDRKFTLINSMNPDWEGLSSNMISSIFQNENGDLWIGTDGMGLNHFAQGS